jgi:acetyltransferase-like isoleucine patch superfamily enzyme
MPVSEQGYAGDRIEIGNNVWIGAHVVILPGVRIGNGAVIGASSVVRTSVPKGEVWAGVPAKFIKAAKDNA